MLILRNKSPIPARCLGAVIALGNFDGLHLGHRAVIGKAVELAKQTGRPAAVLTFEPHPRRVFRPELPPLRIITFYEKACLLREIQMDFMRVIRFTRAFSQTTARQFVQGVLAGELRASHIVTGEDFVFGHNRGGNADLLRKMAVEEGFGYTVCPPVMVEGMRCSSTRVREALAQGRMAEASRLLGRPYSIISIVRAGDQRGRVLGFPTANLLPLSRIFTPLPGIYAVKVKVCGRLADGVASLGTNPTFGGKRLQLEVHLFDWQEDIYGEHMEVIFIKYLRPEKKFNAVEELKKQMAQDCSQAQSVLKSISV